MKNFYKKVASVFLIFFFTYAIFCCSFCNLVQAYSMAQDKNCVTDYSAPTLTSSQNLHPCCCPSKNCAGNSISSVLQYEKSDNFIVKNDKSQFSKIDSLLGKHFTDVHLAFYPQVSYQSLPKSLQKDVPIYLFTRVLRL